MKSSEERYNNRHRCVLYDSKKKSDDNDEEKEEPIENTRRQLESLMGTTNNNNDNDNDYSTIKDTKAFVQSLISVKDEIDLPPPPVLTSIKRENKLAEIDALKELINGDEAVELLWDIWYSEQGLKAKTRIDRVNELMAIPETWSQCEDELISLIEEYGVYFVEPVNRLATLYFLQGRYEQSYKLCKVVLTLKPWHFGALSGIVGVCIQNGDVDSARLWANKRLPGLIPTTSAAPFLGGGEITDNTVVNPKRVEWVNNAMAKAKESIEQADQRTKESFGKPEDYYNNKQQQQQQETDNIDDNEDPVDDSTSWQ